MKLFSSSAALLAYDTFFARLDTRGRVMVAVLLVMLVAFGLSGQQIVNIAREDADAALRVQASAQLAAMAQLTTDAVIDNDRVGLRERMMLPVSEGRLLFVEFVAADGSVLREHMSAATPARPDWFAGLVALQSLRLAQAIVVAGKPVGTLTLQPATHTYEDFLWHLSSHLFVVLAAAFGLLGVLVHLLLKVNLRGLAELRSAVRRIESGDTGVRAVIGQGVPPELRDTLRGFNRMIAARERTLLTLSEQQKALDCGAAVAESDLDGTITYVNELFCVLSGYTRGQLIGQNHRILNSGWHDQPFFEDLWQTIASGRTWRGELCNRSRDGRLIWQATTILPLSGDDGLPQKYLSIRFDITQRKLDEAAIAAEKERWQVTLQSIDDAVIVTDATNRVSYLNPSAEGLLGAALEDATGQLLRNLINLDHAGNVDDLPACFLDAQSPCVGRNGSVRLHTQLG